MKFSAEYPLHSDLDDGAWLDPANIAEFSRAAEAAGVDGLLLTDHPAPSLKWLEHGGHETLDPFVGLGYMAAVTSTTRLLTGLTVVPYRNPFLTAKAMTAVDVLSAGRTTYVLGTGYLRSEFAALGVDFEERNALFDEAVEVMRGVWTDDDFRYEGRHFTALGVVMRPRPVQQPHPPLWLGGNAKIVLRRVIAWGQGWQPLTGVSASTTRTRAIESNEELAGLIREIRDGMDEIGRDGATLDVSTSGIGGPGRDASAEEMIDHIGRLADIGVTWTDFRFPHHSFRAALDGLARFGDEVAAKVR